MNAPDSPTEASHRHAMVAVGVAAAAYVVSLAMLQREPGASVVEPLFLLVPFIGAWTGA